MSPSLVARGPFCNYYVHESHDEGVMVETDVPVKEVSADLWLLLRWNAAHLDTRGLSCGWLPLLSFPNLYIPWFCNVSIAICI